MFRSVMSISYNVYGKTFYFEDLSLNRQISFIHFKWVTSGVAGGLVAHGISNDEVDELKREIEDLKTQIASLEAGKKIIYK